MTQTTQSCSWASFNKAGKDLSINIPETEDNMSLLLSVFDSLNKLGERIRSLDYVLKRKKTEQIAVLDSLNILYEMLNKLNSALQRRNIEQISYPEDKGETK